LVDALHDQLLSELMRLQHRDTDTRAQLLKEGRLYGEYAPEMQQVHRDNAYALDRLIREHGWPGIALVGSDGCRVAWLIAQHAICTPALQRQFRDLLAEAAERGDAPKKMAAFLSDRIRFNENRPQVYGTVLDWNEHGELMCEVEDPENVDARRAAVGLPPFAEDLARHRREVAAEGGQPPADYAAYRERARDWARAAGWI